MPSRRPWRLDWTRGGRSRTRCSPSCSTPRRPTVAALDEADLLALATAHPLVQRLVGLTEAAAHVDDLAEDLFPQEATADPRQAEARRLFLLHLVGMLSHVRAVSGRAAATVDLHLWVRELTRIDRVASSTARYLWSDDGAVVAAAAQDSTSEQDRPPFPAVFCRHCGRSGWGVGLGPVGVDLDTDDATIRRNHAAGEGRFRALLYAPLEADTAFYDRQDVEGLRWFSVRQRAILPAPPPDDDPDFLDGWILPVLTLVGPGRGRAVPQRSVPLVPAGRRDPVPRQRHRDAVVGEPVDAVQRRPP